jgi:hypothetical protein
MATTLKTESPTSPARHAEPWRTAFWVAVALIVAGACVIIAPKLRAARSARSLRAMAARANILPPACVLFLKEERCWLRSVGNEEDSVEVAIGNARAAYERWHHSADSCKADTQFETPAIEAAGCARAKDDPQPLPAPFRVDCPADFFFFVREDGHVSGCHPTCTVSEDCDDGAKCAATGSSVGGPILEPFCE